MKIYCCVYGSSCKGHPDTEKNYKKLKQLLKKRGLADRVGIERFGCLGKCSCSPSVLTMPKLNIHTNHSPKEVCDAVEDGLE